MIGVIGGSGLIRLPGLDRAEQLPLETPYGAPSVPLLRGRFAGKPVVFLPRHGVNHTIPPHLINYRANIWALHHLGVKQIISVASVGAIYQGFAPGQLVLPDQIIDYTSGRETSFFSEEFAPDKHIDFSYPYDEALRQQIYQAADRLAIHLHTVAAYAVTQGPRLETAAEIRRLARDGADIVGMTAMPEAVLARELNLPYASLAIIANRAAGLSTELLDTALMAQTLEAAMQSVLAILAEVFSGYSDSE